jgi:hypothetical protein
MNRNGLAVHSHSTRPLAAAGRWLLLPMAGMALSACVTINIYFPAAAAEKAADKIIDEIMQQPAAKPAAPDSKKEETK